MGDYAVARANGHPKADKGLVLEHVLVAERALGRYLPDGAEVHHVNGEKRNNANRNLVICEDSAFHKLLHVRSRVVMAGGNPDTQRICCSCKGLKTLNEFNRKSDRTIGLQGQCRNCNRAYRLAHPDTRSRADRLARAKGAGCQ